MKDEILTFAISARELCNLIETVSRIARLSKLIQQGNTTTAGGECRFDMTQVCCDRISNFLCSIGEEKGVLRESHIFGIDVASAPIDENDNELKHALTKTVHTISHVSGIEAGSELTELRLYRTIIKASHCLPKETVLKGAKK
jgi:hypothetical protein